MAIPVVSPAAGAAIADGVALGHRAGSGGRNRECRVHGCKTRSNRIRIKTSGGQAQLSWGRPGKCDFYAAQILTVKPCPVRECRGWVYPIERLSLQKIKSS